MLTVEVEIIAIASVNKTDTYIYIYMNNVSLHNDIGVENHNKWLNTLDILRQFFLHLRHNYYVFKCPKYRQISCGPFY